MKRWFITSSALTILLILGCSNSKEQGSRVQSLPYYSDATFTPYWLKADQVPEDFHAISSFELLNQSGHQVTEQNLNDKITVIDFFFTTCPGICPKMTENMHIVQEAFLQEAQVQIFSHTVMPRHDSVSVLQNYAKKKGVIEDKWHLLTGDRSMIYELGRQSYFVEEDLGMTKDPDDFIHTENFVLIDQDRRIRGIYNGLNKSSVNQLIADIRTLIRS